MGPLAALAPPPVLLLLAALAVATGYESAVSFDPPALLPFLNFTFLFLLPTAITVAAGRSYLLLISRGLGLVFLQHAFGSPVGWLGRISQLSGYSDDVIREKGLALATIPILRKPIVVEEFCLRIREELECARQR